MKYFEIMADEMPKGLISISFDENDIYITFDINSDIQQLVDWANANTNNADNTTIHISLLHYDITVKMPIESFLLYNN